MADRHEEDPSFKQEVQAYTSNPNASDIENVMEGTDNRNKNSLKHKILRIVWDSLDKSPKERKFIAKVDTWIMGYVCIAYFVKYLDQTNVSMTSSSILKYGMALTLFLGRQCLRFGNEGRPSYERSRLQSLADHVHRRILPWKHPFPAHYDKDPTFDLVAYSRAPLGLPGYGHGCCEEC